MQDRYGAPPVDGGAFGHSSCAIRKKIKMNQPRSNQTRPNRERIGGGVPSMVSVLGGGSCPLYRWRRGSRPRANFRGLPPLHQSSVSTIKAGPFRSSSRSTGHLLLQILADRAPHDEPGRPAPSLVVGLPHLPRRSTPTQPEGFPAAFCIRRATSPEPWASMAAPS